MDVSKHIKTIKEAMIVSDPFCDTDQYKYLMDAIGDSKIVMIGEASHGTEEFYHARCEMTKILIREHGFNCVLLEADFPPMFKINRFIHGTKPTKENEPSMDIDDIMKDLKRRFPKWMWHNQVFKDFVIWLKDYNEQHRVNMKGKIPVSIIGMDIYSLYTSCTEVVNYLEKVDTSAADVAKTRYSQLMSYSSENNYMHDLMSNAIRPQRDQVTKVLVDLLNHELAYKTLQVDGDEFFNGFENAVIVKEAENYYRKNVLGVESTWNIRDAAMRDIVKHTLSYLKEKQQAEYGTFELPVHSNAIPPIRIVIFAHNSHLGDASATAKAYAEEHNLGMLLRNEFGLDQCFTIGFSSYCGTVRAAESWGNVSQVMEVNPGLKGSSERLFHLAAIDSDVPNYALLLRSNARNPEKRVTQVSEPLRFAMTTQRLQRFIGVCYVKRTERQSHYIACSISDQYDAMFFYDQTSAVRLVGEMALHHSKQPHHCFGVQPRQRQRNISNIDYSKFDEIDESQ